MKIYLAGPINGCTDEQANGWRSQVKALHPDTLDPMARDYRGKEQEAVKDIVEGDKADIDACDGVLVWFERPSVGTSMEVLYAWQKGKPVVVVNRSGKPPSPWLTYHSTGIVEDVAEALAALHAPTAHLPTVAPHYAGLVERLEKAKTIQTDYINYLGAEWGPETNVDEEIAVLKAITDAIAALTQLAAAKLDADALAGALEIGLQVAQGDLHEQDKEDVSWAYLKERCDLMENALAAHRARGAAGGKPT